MPHTDRLLTACFGMPTTAGDGKKEGAQTGCLHTGLRVLARGQDGLLAQVVTTANPYGLRDVSTAEPSLETVFIRLTGRDLRE